MNVAEFNEIILRLERMHGRVQDKAGASSEWRAAVSTGEVHDFYLEGMKPHQEMYDDVVSAYVHAWGIKDPLKPFALASGRSAEWYESTLTAEKCLSICADIANRTKHGDLNKSRARQFARLGELSELNYSMPQNAIATITIGAKSVTTIVEKPELVEVKLPVLDVKDRVIGDAFLILDCAIRKWEQLATDFGVQLPPSKMLKNPGKK